MKKALIIALTAAASTALAEPPQRIDVQQLTGQAAVVDNVVVPLPSEIFMVLDKIGAPHWEDVLRPLKDVAQPRGGQEQTALLLGSVIAEGFLAVEAKNSEEVKKIGKSVLNLAKAINVQKAVMRRSNAIIEAADKENWNQVRKELDGALSDVKEAMAELNSEPLSQLVSLGGWLRGTEALTQVVQKNYTKDGAGLLNQPVLIEYFDRRISSMPKRMKDTPLVNQIQKGLVEIKPLIGTGDAEISEKTVNEVGKIAAGLVQSISSKGNQ